MSNIPSINIAGRRIATDAAPYIIAELSANHNGSFDTALEIIKQAKTSGADAIKLQTYTADTITLNSDSEDFKIHGGLWDGETLYSLYEKAHMPWEWHKPLFEYARELDITMFSSPFDNTAVDLLEDLNAPAYKIASFEAIDLPLIRYVASTGKPMIISTGMADDKEIQEAIDAARSGGCKELAILHCVSGYPAPAGDYNLRTLLDMRERFGLVTGLSDHTIDNTTAITSVALGASIIEKHFTLDRTMDGPDHKASLEPSELKTMVDAIRNIELSMGTGIKEPADSEKKNIAIARKSIVANQSIKKGDILTETNLTVKRPGDGISPMKWFEIIGTKAIRDFEEDELIEI